MTDSVKDEIKGVCKPVLDHKNDEQVVVTNETHIIQKSFYEEVGDALQSLDKCDSQSDLSSVNSADINQVKNMFEHIFLPDDRSKSEEFIEII